MEKSIGERIIGLRKKKGMTQLQLAEKLNISDKAVSKWESGKGCPSVELLELLSDLFDCSIDYLVKGRDKAITSKNDYMIENAELDEKLTYSQEVWQKALKIIKTKVSAISFDVWFSSIKAINIEPGFVNNEYFMVLLVPNLRFKHSIVNNFQELLLESIGQVDETITSVLYKIEDVFSDPYFQKAVKLSIINKAASVAYIQRTLQIGYSRAASLIDAMEEMNFISSMQGRKYRDVYITEEKYEEVFLEKFDNKI